MFGGATSLSVDAKGRLVLPAKHRDAIQVQSQGRLVLTAHPHGCLLLYPQPVWEPIQAKIMSLSSFDKRSSGLQRLLVGHREELELDGAGRILLSPELREFAGLSKEVMLVGQGSHFEIWCKAAWKQTLAPIREEGGFEMPAELEGFSL